MTNKEYLANAKVGEIITNKSILSALKKKGLISDYSAWGYLESAKIFFKDEWDGKEITDYDFIDLFPNGTADECRKRIFESREEMVVTAGFGSIEYMGCKFDTKYLDGCFSAYLQLVEKNGKSEKETNPRMSVFGAIV